MTRSEKNLSDKYDKTCPPPHRPASNGTKQTKTGL